MSIIRATKKPIVIEAVLWDKTGKAQKSMGDFVPSDQRRTDYSECDLGECPELYIVTLEGEMHVSKGDYVIKGVQGEFYPCKPEIFNETYNF